MRPVRMIVVASTLMLAAAACDAAGIDPVAIEGLWATRSVETEIEGASGPVGGTMQLDGGSLGGRVFGFNDFSGRYDFDGRTIDVSEVFSTLAGCECPVNSLENQFGSRFDVTVESDTRMIWSNDTMTIEFELIGLPPPPGEPTDDVLVVDSNTTLDSDHRGAIDVVADDVTLDCGGHQVVGPGETGIAVIEHHRVTIQNCVVVGFTTGIRVEGAKDSRLVGVTTSANNVGMSLDRATDSHVDATHGRGNRTAHIDVQGGTGIVVENSTLVGGRTGITVTRGKRNSFRNNEMAPTAVGISAQRAVATSFTANRVKLKDGRGVGLDIADAVDVTLGSNRVSNAGTGFRLTGTGNTIEANETVDTVVGFSLGDPGALLRDQTYESADNTFRDNRAENAETGFRGFVSGPGNDFIDNIGFTVAPIREITADTVLDRDHAGSIVIAADDVALDCAGHEIIGIEPNPEPLAVYGTGIEVRGRRNVRIENCVVRGFEIGIGLWDSRGNSIEGNVIGDAGVGIWLMESDDNEIVANEMLVATDGAARDHAPPIGIVESDGNSIAGNASAEALMALWKADGNTVVGNDAWRLSLVLSTDNLVEENTSSDFISLARSDDNTLASNTAASFKVSRKSMGNRLVGNVADGDGIGFAVTDESSGNHFEGNRAMGSKIGFRLRLAHDNTFIGNDASGAEEGLELREDATGNIFTGNIGF